MILSNIYIVVVLYNKRLEESKTIQSLGDILEDHMNLMVYDNSPIRQYECTNFTLNKFKVHYYHDQTNSGLSKAYNLAINLANELNFSWLLLLDQDTTFTRNYIEEILSLDIIKMPENVVAIIPKIVSSSNGMMISPAKMLLGGITIPIKNQYGILNNKVSAINSGTILKILYMESINGFSLKYTLDMLDHWYYRKIYEDKKVVYLLHSFIYQDLSVSGNFEENVSPARYKQMLKSELLYIKGDGLLSLSIFKLRLIFRIIKQLGFKRKCYCRLTIKYLFR